MLYWCQILIELSVNVLYNHIKKVKVFFHNWIMMCLFVLPLWETFNGLCINQVLAVWCVGTHLLPVFSETQTHTHTAPAPHHKMLYLVNFLCTLSPHLSIANHRIKRGPTVGTLAGGATSGDKLALDASTEQICAPPQHCGADRRRSGQPRAYLPRSFMPSSSDLVG